MIKSLLLQVMGTLTVLAAQGDEQIWENSIGMQLVRIPPGVFTMGSAFEEKGRQSDEFPHIVQVTKAFRIARTEVTQAQWRAVMGTDRSQFRGDLLPVEKVSWKDAVLFCEKLSLKEDRQYRLPTEAEWEYACRAGSDQAYAGSGDAAEMAWTADNSEEQTHPVATRRANAWNLYDMHGNVAEWCQDAYQSDYPAGESLDPCCSKDSPHKVMRGGSWASFWPGCRSAARSNAPSSYQLKQTGFRVVMEIKP